MTNISGTIYELELLNEHGVPERVVDIVARMQRNGVPQKLIDRWIQGLSRGTR
jgi:hypothetical protein